MVITAGFEGVGDTADVMLGYGGPVLIGVAVLLVLVHLVERRRDIPLSGPRARLGNTLAVVSGAVVGLLLWILWFSWSAPGSVAPVAAVGASACAFGALVWLGLRTRWPWTGPPVVALAGLTSFSTIYAVTSDHADVTGLWAIGYLMMIVGGTVILTVVSLGIAVVRSSDRGA